MRPLLFVICCLFPVQRVEKVAPVSVKPVHGNYYKISALLDVIDECPGGSGDGHFGLLI